MPNSVPLPKSAPAIVVFCLYVVCISMASLKEILFYLSNQAKHYEGTTDLDKRRKRYLAIINPDQSNG
jgi:hypothetical protein